MKIANLFESLPVSLPNELTTKLAAGENFHVERIVSTGHATPDDKWYDESLAEWVVMLSGSARIRFADEQTEFELRPGDYLNIPPHCRHRVTWTSASEPTVWLAIHYEPA